MPWGLASGTSYCFSVGQTSLAAFPREPAVLASSSAKPSGDGKAAWVPRGLRTRQSRLPPMHQALSCSLEMLYLGPLRHPGAALKMSSSACNYCPISKPRQPPPT